MGSQFRRPAWLWLCLLAVLILSPAKSVGAQSGASAVVFLLETENFPVVSLYLQVRDAGGDFMPGLQPSQLAVIEDGLSLPVIEIEQIRSGAQFTLVLNPGQSFGIRDGSGFSRYDHLLSVFDDWAVEWNEANEDVLSLLVQDGPEAINLTEPSEWVAILEDYQADFRNAEPNLDLLAKAVEMATDLAPQPGMGRAVLFVTPPADDHYTVGIQTIAARAEQQGVRIHVWLVSSPDFFNSRGALLFEELASQTGGHFHTFSGVESLPDLNHYLEPLRDIYRLSYQSGISTPGEHEIAVQIDSERGLIVSPSQHLDLDVYPPHPIFVSSPSRIMRTSLVMNRMAEIDLNPDEQVIEIVVEFPDGMPRQIVSSFLYVDGEIVDTNVDHPYDRFLWNLDGYIDSGTHLVMAEVVDSWGLSGQSAEIPIHVAVQLPKKTIWMTIARNGPLLAGAAVVFSGSILLLVLIVGGKIRPHMFDRSKIRTPQKGPLQARLTRPFKHGSSDPVTQPVRGAETREESPWRLSQWINRLQWPQRQVAVKALAYLTRLVEAEEATIPIPIPITTDLVVIGKDPFKATLLLDDPAVENVHARLRREENSFRLSDEGSVAGTWVNYTPVSKEGILLEHGDLIHIGRTGFRFTLRKPTQFRKPVVLPEEPPL